MYQITWFWPPKLKNLPTVGGGTPPSRSVASLPLGLGRSAPSHLFSKYFLCFSWSKTKKIPPPPHFWRPVYATGHWLPAAGAGPVVPHLTALFTRSLRAPHLIQINHQWIWMFNLVGLFDQSFSPSWLPHGAWNSIQTTSSARYDNFIKFAPKMLWQWHMRVYWQELNTCNDATVYKKYVLMHAFDMNNQN